MIAKMRSGVVAALQEHKRLGRSIVTYNLAAGQVRELPGPAIPVETDQTPRAVINPTP